MTHKPRAAAIAKAERALELTEKGISHEIVAERLGVSKCHVYDLVQKARARREQEAPQQ